MATSLLWPLPGRNGIVNIGVDEILSAFPALNPEKLAITSPATPLYNCIAWAGGDTYRKWWPDVTRIGYWPKGVPRIETITAFQMAFETLGFVLCASDRLEDGQEKIAFFHKDKIPTHAARQLPNGLWTSKLGESFDVAHDLHGLEGAQYGRLALIMQRATK